MADNSVMPLLQKLHDGDVTLGEVVQDFTGRKWKTPADAPTPADSAEDLLREETLHVEGGDIEAGTWEEVSAAATRHLISNRQYRALFDAVHGAKTPPDAT